MNPVFWLAVLCGALCVFVLLSRHFSEIGSAILGVIEEIKNELNNKEEK